MDTLQILISDGPRSRMTLQICFYGKEGHAREICGGNAWETGSATSDTQKGFAYDSRRLDCTIHHSSLVLYEKRRQRGTPVQELGGDNIRLSLEAPMAKRRSCQRAFVVPKVHLFQYLVELATCTLHSLHLILSDSEICSSSLRCIRV